MPNRIIKESVCTSDNLDSLSWFEECCFYRLLVNCDDYGRMDARPAILRARLFPLKTVTDKQIETALKSLRSAAMIDIYDVDGHSYLQMRTWEKHQSIRAKRSKYPAPDDNCKHMQADEIICKQMQADDFICSRNPIQSESNPNLNPNPNIGANTRRADAKNDFEEYAKGDENLLKALEEFAEMRKSIKKPLTGAAVTRLLARLDGFQAEERTAILNQSVDHCWQDIYPLKTAPVQRGKNVQASCDRNAPTDTEYDDMKALLEEIRGDAG